MLKFNEFLESKQNITYKYEYEFIDAAFEKIFLDYLKKSGRKYINKGSYVVSNTNLDDLYNISDRLYKIINKTKVNVIKYEDIFSYTADQYVDEFGYTGFNSDTDAIEYMNEMLNQDFPFGYKNMPENLILYRVLFLKNPAHAKKSEMGCHFIADKNTIDDNFLMSIGMDTMDNDNRLKIYIFKIEVKRDDIDFNYSISNNLAFPREYEITTKTKKPDIKILGYEKY